MEPRRSARASLGGGRSPAVGARRAAAAAAAAGAVEPRPAPAVGQQGATRAAALTDNALLPAPPPPPAASSVQALRKGTIPSSPIAILGYRPPARASSSARPSAAAASAASQLSPDTQQQHDAPGALLAPVGLEPLALPGPSASAAASAHLPPSAAGASAAAAAAALPSSQQPPAGSDTSPLHPHSSSPAAAAARAPSSSAAHPLPPPPPTFKPPRMVKPSSSAAAAATAPAAAGVKRASLTGAGPSAPHKKKKTATPAAAGAEAADGELVVVDEGPSSFKAGDVELEFKTVDGAQLVLGKGGKWFDFNPGPNGTGIKDGEVVFECFMCDKVYLGVHARSIWRRHLKDKHKIPLSLQPRRTRWDGRDEAEGGDRKGKKKATPTAAAKRPRPKKTPGGPSSASSIGGGYSDSANDGADASADDLHGSESEIEGLMPSASTSRAAAAGLPGRGKGKGKGKGKAPRGARPVSPPATIEEELGGGLDGYGGQYAYPPPAQADERDSSPDYYAAAGGGEHRPSPEHEHDADGAYAHYAPPPPAHFHPEQSYYYQPPYGLPPQPYTAYDHFYQPPPPPPALVHSAAGYSYAPGAPQVSHLTAYPPQQQQQQQYALPYGAMQHEQQYAYPYGYTEGHSSYARDEPIAAAVHDHPHPSQLPPPPVAAGFPQHQQQEEEPFFAPHGRTIYRRSSFPSALRAHPHLLAETDGSPARSHSAAPESPSRPHTLRRHGSAAGRGAQMEEDEGDAAELLMQLKQSSPLKPNHEDEVVLNTDDDGNSGVVRPPGRRVSHPSAGLQPARGLLPAADLDPTTSRRSRSVSRSARHSQPADNGPASPLLLGANGRAKSEALDSGAACSLAGASAAAAGDVALRTHLTRSPAFPRPSSPFQAPSSSPVNGRHRSQSGEGLVDRDAFVTPYGKLNARRTSFRPTAAVSATGDDEKAGPAERTGGQDGAGDAEPGSSAHRHQPSSPAFPTDDSPRPTKDGEEQASGRRRDGGGTPLVPLFAQPQLPPQRRSITATTPLISSLTRTTLPAWHPTPLKSSSTMTALDYTPVVSSTRTPFRSSSGSKSAGAGEGDDRLAPLKSIRYTPGGFGGALGSTPHQPSLSNGSSPPLSSLSVLSSPQSLGLTRSLGLAPATPGGQWDHLHANTFGTPDDNLLIGSLKKRRGSWAVGPSAAASAAAAGTATAGASGSGYIASSSSSSTVGSAGRAERPRKRTRTSLDGVASREGAALFEVRPASAAAGGAATAENPAGDDAAAAAGPHASPVKDEPKPKPPVSAIPT